MRNLEINKNVHLNRIRVIHKKRMQINTVNSFNRIVVVVMFIISILFVMNDFFTVPTGLDEVAFTNNQLFALIAFGCSAYFGFIERVKIKYPDLIFSAYAIQFLLILFTWMFRYNHSIMAI